ncbi:hypothetical protein L9F63_016095 [Diploptera punctata]|uniref:Uncharacterized protein n=1 Tax=Diploptera punctata TaxID=6984 RepID=A0AAD8A1P2_DIPPU|nr:hypothetical protein L9F63_016095 [Diploptera punctata]
MAIISFRNVTFAHEVIKNDQVLFYLTHCVLDIVQNNFNKDMPIAIQTPDTWSEAHISIFPSNKSYNEYMFFKWFNLKNTIPYTILGYMENFKTRNENGPKPGSNILLVPDQEISIIYGTLNPMLLRMNYNSRNIGAKTVIALMEPAKSERYVLRLSMVILQLAFEIHQLENVIVIVPFITLDQGSKMYIIYLFAIGWLPEEQGNICSQVINNPKIAGTWTSQRMKYQYRELFPKKTMTDMRQCRVRISTSTFEPLVVTTGTGLAGFFPNIIQVASEILNFQPSLSHEEPFIVIPVSHHSGIDECTVTYPYVRADFTWYVPSGEQIPGWRNLIGIFTPTTWFLVLLAFISRTATHWLLVIVSNRFRNTQMDTDFVCVLMGSFLSQLGMGCKENYKGTFIVFFFLLWICYCLQIYTLYQSSLFGCLLKPTEYPPIKTLKQLEESDIEMVQCVDIRGPGTKLNITYDKCTKYAGVTSFGTSEANVAYFNHILSYNLYYNVHKALGIKAKYVTLEEIILSEYVAFSVSGLGCMFYNKLNKMQHRLYSSGIMNQWMKEMTEKIWRSHFRETASGDVETLKLLHLQGLLYLLSIGLTLAFVIFVIEILIGRVNSTRK